MDTISSIDVGADYLAHHGVLGMKWGVRKAENQRNPNYSNDQRKRDRQIYGGRGVKRINRNLNKGDSISTARGSEKTRRDSVLSKNKYVRQGGKIAGAIGGFIGGQVAISTLTRVAHSKPVIAFMDRYVGRGVQEGVVMTLFALNQPSVRLLVGAGAAAVGNMLAGDAAVSVYTRAHGYNPNRK